MSDVGKQLCIATDLLRSQSVYLRAFRSRFYFFYIESKAKIYNNCIYQIKIKSRPEGSQIYSL